MIYIRDFEAVQKPHSRVLSGLKTRGEKHSWSFLKQYLKRIWPRVNPIY